MTLLLICLTGVFVGSGAGICATAVGRRASLSTAIVVNSAVSFVLVILMFATLRPPTQLPDLGWGLAAGMVGGLSGLVAVRAMMIGPVGVAVPVTVGCGASVVVAVASFRTGLSGADAAGVLLCLGALVISTFRPKEAATQGHASTTVVLAVVAGVGSAATTLLLAQSSPASPLVTLTAVRTAAAAIAAYVFVTRRREVLRHISNRNVLPLCILAGTLDVGANGLLLVALTFRDLITLAVVGATAPMVSALLALLFLGERLEKRQLVGIAVTCMGLVVIGLT